MDALVKCTRNSFRSARPRFQPDIQGPSRFWGFSCTEALPLSIVGRARSHAPSIWDRSTFLEAADRRRPYLDLAVSRASDAANRALPYFSNLIPERHCRCAPSELFRLPSRSAAVAGVAAPAKRRRARMSERFQRGDHAARKPAWGLLVFRARLVCRWSAVRRESLCRCSLLPDLKRCARPPAITRDHPRLDVSPLGARRLAIALHTQGLPPLTIMNSAASAGVNAHTDDLDVNHFLAILRIY